VNIAGPGGDGNAFGLLSLVGNGYRAWETWLDEAGVTSTGLKFGGRHMYTLISASHDPRCPESVGAAMGWGGHFRLGGRLWLDLDASGGLDARAAPPSDERVGLLYQLRTGLGLRLVGSLGIFGGIGISSRIAFDRRHAPRGPLGPEAELHLDDNQTSVRFGPTVFAGLQL
jgi:hypothetical protein